MPVTLKSDPVLLREDATGALRVGQTRVLLELVIQAFEEGATPEAIVQRYTTLTLPDVYAVIAYYLRHRDEIGMYLRIRGDQAKEIQQRITESQRDLTEIRGRLLAQRSTGRPGHAATGQ